MTRPKSFPALDRRLRNDRADRDVLAPNPAAAPAPGPAPVAAPTAVVVGVLVRLGTDAMIGSIALGSTFQCLAAAAHWYKCWLTFAESLLARFAFSALLKSPKNGEEEVTVPRSSEGGLQKRHNTSDEKRGNDN